MILLPCQASKHIKRDRGGHKKQHKDVFFAYASHCGHGCFMGFSLPGQSLFAVSGQDQTLAKQIQMLQQKKSFSRP